MFKWLFGKKKGAATGNAELVVVSCTVPVPMAQAFEGFVDRFNDWWPRDFTLGGDGLRDIVIEAKIGGRCLERTADGTESVWGTVLTMTRPDHIVLAWQIKPDRTPEAGEATASRIDVRFIAADPNTTEVVLVHRDFPRHGAGWETYRASMAAAEGWPRLIDLYAKAVGGG